VGVDKSFWLWYTSYNRILDRKEVPNGLDLFWHKRPWNKRVFLPAQLTVDMVLRLWYNVSKYNERRSAMARIGNETKLILKLAKEQVDNDKRSLELEIEFRARPGNHPENLTWQEAMLIGYRVGISKYNNTLNNIAHDLETSKIAE
jgi:hypothetical protein